MVRITEYGVVVDDRRCIGCHACTVASRAERWGLDSPTRSSVDRN